MSVRSEVKDMITHFVHDREYVEERTKWRGLLRTMKTAQQNLTGAAKKRRKASGNASAGTATSEGAGEGNQA